MLIRRGRRKVTYGVVLISLVFAGCYDRNATTRQINLVRSEGTKLVDEYRRILATHESAKPILSRGLFPADWKVVETVRRLDPNQIIAFRPLDKTRGGSLLAFGIEYDREILDGTIVLPTVGDWIDWQESIVFASMSEYIDWRDSFPIPPGSVMSESWEMRADGSSIGHRFFVDGRCCTLSFDRTGRIESRTYTSEISSGGLVCETFSFDGAGRIRSIHRTIGEGSFDVEQSTK